MHGAGDTAEGAVICAFLIVPTLRVVTHRLTLRVDLDAERPAMHSHAKRGHDHTETSPLTQSV